MSHTAMIGPLEGIIVEGVSIISKLLPSKSQTPSPGSAATAASLPFAQRIAQLGLVDLWHKSERPDDESIIKLAMLQRMNICAIQKGLVDQVGIIQNQKTIEAVDMAEIRTLMREYTTALRDWETILDYTAKAKGDLRLDPFTLTSARALELGMMIDARLVSENDKNVKVCSDFTQPIMPGGSRKFLNQYRNTIAFWERLCMGAFGGIALIGPMLIMVLHHDRTTSLVTTSLSVSIFAIAIARYSSATPEGVLGAVAAYAAVLVVFVGTTSL